MFLYSLSGGELLAHLAKKEMSTEEEYSHYIRQVLEGLHYIHSNNIIHMAIKVGVSPVITMETLNIFCLFVCTASKYCIDLQPSRHQTC